jgi:hypothetical protein
MPDLQCLGSVHRVSRLFITKSVPLRASVPNIAILHIPQVKLNGYGNTQDGTPTLAHCQASPETSERDHNRDFTAR